MSTNSLNYNDFDKCRKYGDIGEEKPGDRRSAFEIDRARIIHSSAFRRLQGKTQVYTPEAGDFHRTRLTHSLEVAQIAKGLAIQLDVDPDLLEAISLAHDLGHPPFGHAGEETFSEWMMPYGGFEQNAQSFRIVTRLEAKFPDFPERGLNLTRATLDGILKYKTPFNRGEMKRLLPQERKFYYAEDQDMVRWASDGDHSQQSLECQIMDWADDVAYAVHDLEDAIHFGLITRATLDDPSICEAILERALRELQEKLQGAIGIERKIEREWECLQRSITNSMEAAVSYAKKRALRKARTSTLIARFLLKDVKKRQRACPPVDSDRYRYELDVPHELRVCQTLLTSLVRKCVIESRPGRTLQFKSQQLLNDLWKAFMKASGELLPADWFELYRQQQDFPGQARIICDYLAGMTDDYARRIHAWLYDRDAGWHPQQLP